MFGAPRTNLFSNEARNILKRGEGKQAMLGSNKYITIAKKSIEPLGAVAQLAVFDVALNELPEPFGAAELPGECLIPTAILLPILIGGIVDVEVDVLLSGFSLVGHFLLRMPSTQIGAKKFKTRANSPQLWV